MPHRRLPNSVPAVLRTLKTARDTYANTPNAADRAIIGAQFAELDDTVPASLLNRFIKEASDVDIAQAQQAPLSTAVAQNAALVTMLCSHFHQVYDLGVARGIFTAGGRSFYGRDVSASALPDLSSYDAVVEAAQAIVDGEVSRQQTEGAAYVPMALPSAAEVAAALDAFTTARAQSQQAQVKTDTQSEELMALYPAAHDLAVDICDTVEFFYRKDPDEASRRTKCARWGVVYIFDPNEPQPAPAVTPTPTPPANP